MGHSWISTLGFVAILATCLFAWVKGGSAERQGAIWLLACEFAGEAVLALTSPASDTVWMLVVDFALAVGLLALALVHSSVWLGAAMLLESFALCGHAMVFSGDEPEPALWILLNNIVTELMLVCIVTATIAAWRARLRKTTAPQPATIAGLKLGHS